MRSAYFVQSLKYFKYKQDPKVKYDPGRCF